MSARPIVAYRVRWTSHGGFGETSVAYRVGAIGLETVNDCRALAYRKAADLLQAPLSFADNIRVLRIVRGVLGERGPR